MLFGALPVVRRRGYFEMFYWTHLTYILFLSIQCFHSPSGLYWTVLPGLVFSLCKLQTFLALCLGETHSDLGQPPTQHHSGYRQSMAVEATALQSSVTRLVLEREFDFTPGDYVIINIPQISKFEWHPFTISSPPEEEGVFSLHIRGVGGWTKALHRLVTSGPASWTKPSLRKVGPELESQRDLKVYIDGPHSAPSSTVYSSEHAVLVATGIGVTPFASILQSLIERVRRGQGLGALRRVDFIWVNREYRSMEWFLLLLRDLERSVFSNFLTVQLYVSSGPSTANDDTLSLALALDLLYKVLHR